MTLFDDVAAGFVNLLKPDNPISIVLIAGIIIGGFFFWRMAMRMREPDSKRLDRYVLTMPKIGHQAGVIAYEYPQAKELPNLEGLKEIPEVKDHAQFLIEHQKEMFHYLLKYDGSGTIKSGKAIMLTHNRIDDPDFSEPMESVFDFVQLSKVHRRLLAQAATQGRIFEDAVDFDGEIVDLIYYPMMSTDPGQRVVILPDPHATLQIAAQIKEFVVTQQKSKFNEIQRKAAERGKELAESELKATTEKYNFTRREWAKKDYWGATLSTLGSPLSLAIVGIMVGGSAMLLPDMLKQWMPGYTDYHYRGLAVMFGLLGVWAVQHFRK